ncbi:MAG: rod-binding protein [bacterium]
MSGIPGLKPMGHAIGRVARPNPNASQAEKLRGTAQQLQSVFVEQMFKAMRETVPEDGEFSGGQGEAMFRGLLDQQVAETVPSQWTGDHSLGEVLVRQLSRSFPETPAAPASAQEK